MAAIKTAVQNTNNPTNNQQGMRTIDLRGPKDLSLTLDLTIPELMQPGMGGVTNAGSKYNGSKKEGYTSLLNALTFSETVSPRPFLPSPAQMSAATPHVSGLHHAKYKVTSVAGIEHRRNSAVVRFSGKGCANNGLNFSQASRSTRLRPRLDRSQAHVGKECNSLDYSTILPSSTKEQGTRLGGRPRDPVNKELSPGPGHYQIRYNSIMHAQRAIFGTERRDACDRLEKKDQRTFHVNIFEKNPLRGHTFGKCRRSMQTTPGVLSVSATPGPGYYNNNAERAIMPKPTSYSISLTEAFQHKRRSEGSPDVSMSNPKPSLAVASNYQKFSQLSKDRSSGKHRYDYHRIIYPKNMDTTIVHRNIEELKEETPESRVRRILENKVKLRVKIDIVQRTKQSMRAIVTIGILDESIERITLDKQEAERRRLISKEKTNTWKIANAWTGLATVEAWLKCLARKYNTRREVRKRTNKLMRVLFVCFLAVGKIRRRLRGASMRRAIRLMSSVAKANQVFWRMRRKITARKRVAKFVQEFEASPTMLLFLKFVICKIRRVQKWFRRIYTQKMMMMAIMNMQWSAVEAVVINARLAGKKEGSIREAVNEAIKLKKASNIVPLPVRLFYINKWLKAANERYYSERKEYWRRYKEEREAALRAHELRNIENMLRGIPPAPFVFQSRCLPKFKVFLTRADTVDLVNKSLVERIKWDSIIKKRSSNELFGA